MEFDYSTIGETSDIEQVARAAISYYLGKGNFVTVADQKVKANVNRTDLVAFDYNESQAISVEVESISEVNSHMGQVKKNMLKWKDLGFQKCHVWSKSPRIREAFDALTDEERKDVEIFVV